MTAIDGVEDGKHTNRWWIFKSKRRCPHCQLPLDVEVHIPVTYPKPEVKVKGGVKARLTLSVPVPHDPPKDDPDAGAGR